MTTLTDCFNRWRVTKFCVKSVTRKRAGKRTKIETFINNELFPNLTMKMLIELSGPASSGKTTLAEMLAERNGWKFVPEPVYEDVSKELENESRAQTFQINILENHYYNLIASYFGPDDIVVTDRSLRDLSIYGFLNCDDEEFRSVYSHTVTGAYAVLQSYYTIIPFYCDSVGFVDNGIRTDRAYEVEKDLFERAYSFMDSIPDTLEERINHVESEVTKWL